LTLELICYSIPGNVGRLRGGARVMKRFLVLIALLGLLAPASIAHAQQDSRPAGSQENGLSAQLENGTILYLELAKTVDAKKAKIGDEVTAFLLADVVSHGKIAVRRDSELIGHVTEARPQTKDNPESRLGIVFDRIHARHGPEISFSSVLLAVRPSLQIQTEPPPAMGTRGPNSTSSHSDLGYSIPRSSSRLNAGVGQEFGAPVNSRANMQLMEIDGLSLQPSPDGSNRVVVSFKRTVKLESRMRLELRVENKAK
jgi:hypothetical protein